METLLAIIGLVVYGVASLIALSSLFNPGVRRERLELNLLAGGALIFLVVMVMRVVKAGCLPAFSRFDGLTWYALALSGTYLLMKPRRFARGISGLLMPFATGILLWGLPAHGVPAGVPPPNQGVLLVVHVIMGYAAYAVFSLASINAAAYLIQDYNLKNKQFGAVWEQFPSLETLDHVMSRLVGLAFLFLTVASVGGLMLAHQSGAGDKWLTDPKVAAVTAAWIFFAVLVHIRASSDRHGRGVAMLTVIGLVLVLFAFVGVPLLVESIHSFLQIRTGVVGS
jgi:ABC-type uncharacterized transport system permease subunit